MSTAASRQYNFTDDKNNSVPITASRMDAEFDNTITKLNQKVMIKATAPTDIVAGVLWYDSTNKLLKEYRNSEWVIHGMVHIGGTAHATPQDGDLWYDITNNCLKVYDTSAWFIKANMEFPTGTAYGDTFFTALTTTALSRLAKSGTTGLVLTNNGVSNTPLWGKVNLSGGLGVSGILPLSNTAADMAYANTRFKMGTFTLTNLSGTQAITNVGFQPKLVSLKAFCSSGQYSFSIGDDDATSHYNVRALIQATSQFSGDATYSIYVIDTIEDNRLMSYIQSIDADGFTLHTDKNGTGATVTVYYVAYR